MKATNEQLKKAADTVRLLAADMIEAANSGHPGAPMGLADLAVSLWLKYLEVDPTDVTWPARDRLVFSGGHASALVYALSHLAGVPGAELDQLKSFRQLGSRCAGHPERGVMPGVEVSTGPLGQGIAMGVGLALAARKLNRANRTWVFCGDGDLEEGISHEAASFAGHLGLDRLILIYDSNGITIEGEAKLALSDDAKKRFESYGWKVFACNGHDYDEIDRTLRRASKVEGAPVLIVATTTIGKGAPTKAGTAGIHGAPLGAEELAATKAALGFDPATAFAVPEDVRALFAERVAKCRTLHRRWNRAHKADVPFKAASAADLLAALPAWDAAKPVATRNACGTILTALASVAPQLVGGSADLAPSNKTEMKGAGWIGKGDWTGRNIHFGIRELAMSAIVNGLTAYGTLRGYGATFFVFADYCKPAMRLAALMKLPSLWIFSHDSFYVGEDGPTHQPVEQSAMLRAMPGLEVFRPADATETGYCLVEMLRRLDGPSCLLTTRQNLPILPEASAGGVARGAYTLWQNGVRPDLLFIATGSEVSLCLEAARKLADEGRSVRVVSMPCRERFEAQDLSYRESVIPLYCRRRVIAEAGVKFGWEAYAVDAQQTRYVSLDAFGASAPCARLAEEFGFTADRVFAVAKELY